MSKIIFFSDQYTTDQIKKCVYVFPDNLPKWFEKMPSAFYSEKHDTYVKGLGTVKRCPGLINYFKRGFLFTCPFDLQVLFDEKGNIEFHSAGQVCNDGFVHLHPSWQYLDHVQSDFQSILKIIFKISIKTDVGFLMSSPWWNGSPFETIPGVISKNYSKDLNCFIPMPKNIKSFEIKKGAPLFFGHFLTENKVDIKFSNKNLISQKDSVFIKTFSNLKQSIMDRI